MNNLMKKRLIMLAFLTLLGLSVLAAVYLIIIYTDVGYKCPFHAITGLNCPGCGNTRAVTSLLHFEFKESLSYNYIYPLELFYLLRIYCIAAKNYIKKGKFSYSNSKVAFDIAALVIIILWFIIRNIFGI